MNGWYDKNLIQPIEFFIHMNEFCVKGHSKLGAIECEWDFKKEIFITPSGVYNREKKYFRKITK